MNNKVTQIDDAIIPILSIQDIEGSIGKEIVLKGVIHRLRMLPNVTFMILRLERSLVQVVAEPEQNLSDYKEGDFVEIKGKVQATLLKDKAIAPANCEIILTKINIINKEVIAPPFEINKKELNIKLELELDMRPVSLRHPKRRAIFKIEETIVDSFAQFLHKQGFTRIFSPKIVFAGAEGGANIFKIDYFGKNAFLTQSPQFYKQFGVGIFGRVYDIGTVFRAEKHNTTRHINEYVSLDLEMGFIESHLDVMKVEVAFLRYLINQIKKENAFEVDLLELTLPKIPENIPSMKLKDAHDLVYENYKKDFRNEPDLAPEEERLLSQWALREYSSDFLFITHYPTKKRPFYTKDDPDSQEETRSFDLLFRGVEITTGGQRIHLYSEQVKKMKDFGLNPDDFTSFLQMHQHGVPPHGGLAIGLERLCAKICNLENVKEATMYPRDINRLTP